MPRQKKIHYCKNCGKELNERHKTYCNNNCQLEFQYKDYIRRWKNGEESGIIGQYQLSNHIKHYLYDKYNGQCARCGWHEINPTTGKSPLEVEHIDGNYRNNTEDNLILLCPNCHSLTPTYKALNKGNGRKDREKYSLYKKD